MIAVRGLLRGLVGGAVVAVTFSLLALTIAGKGRETTVIPVLWFVVGIGIVGLGLGAVCGLASSLIVMQLSGIAPNWVLRIVSGLAAATTFKLVMMLLTAQFSWYTPSVLDICAFIAGVVLCPGDIATHRDSSADSTSD